MTITETSSITRLFYMYSYHCKPSAVGSQNSMTDSQLPEKKQLKSESEADVLTFPDELSIQAVMAPV